MAQKSSTTTSLPLLSARWNGLPPTRSRVKSGAGLPTSGDSVPESPPAPSAPSPAVTYFGSGAFFSFHC